MTGEGSGERGKAEWQAASVTFLHQLNEVQDGLLLAATADGAVRVWRNYALKGEQRLATAWQVGGPTPTPPAALLTPTPWPPLRQTAVAATEEYTFLLDLAYSQRNAGIHSCLLCNDVVSGQDQSIVLILPFGYTSQPRKAGHQVILTAC